MNKEEFEVHLMLLGFKQHFVGVLDQGKKYIKDNLYVFISTPSEKFPLRIAIKKEKEHFYIATTFDKAFEAIKKNLKQE